MRKRDVDALLDLPGDTQANHFLPLFQQPAVRTSFSGSCLAEMVFSHNVLSSPELTFLFPISQCETTHSLRWLSDKTCLLFAESDNIC
jgi:hypothetical protein